MGNWARQGDLNDKLGGAVKINSSDNYWPTKSQILNNWNAEVSGTYADNQWCDIDTVKEGSVDIYKRFYEYVVLLYDELFEDIVGPKKCDICLVSGGGASGKWSGWGSGFGGPGGGGQVLSVLDIYFEHLYKPGAYAVMTPGIGGVGEVGALTSMFHLYYTSPTANKDFFRNTYVGGKGSRGLGGLSSDTQKNTNGRPGPGGSGIVYQMTYTNPNTGEGATLNTRKTYSTNRNTAYFWESRQDTYKIPGGWEDNFAIPEFGEDDVTKTVTHGAPGHYLWHDKYRTDAGVEITRTPNKYISTCPFNNGGGALIINGKKDVQSENNKGGRGGGGAGGGAGGSDYHSGAYGAGYSFSGGDGAVIVRYKAKRFFPADKKWIFKLNVGNITAQTAYAFGILLEGKYFIYMGKDIKRDDGTTYKDAPIQKYLQTEYSGTTITWEKEVPADFHPTKVWLVVAKDSNTLAKDDVYWSIRAGAAIISDNYLYKQVSKRFYLDNIRNDYQTCEDSIARYEKDNRSLSYIDITDVFKYYMPNNTTNEYRFQINKGYDVTRALRCASSLLPEGVKPFGIKSISAVISGTSIAIISSVFGDIGFRDKTGEMCYLFELRVGNRDSYKPDGSGLLEYYNVTFTFDVPSGYKLKFNENIFLSTGYGTVLSTTNNSVTINYSSQYFHPNTDKRHCDFGHVFGEYGCAELGSVWVTRSYQYVKNSISTIITLNPYTIKTLVVVNKTTSKVLESKILGLQTEGDVTKLVYQIKIDDTIKSTDTLQLGMIFDVSEPFEASIGGSGLYTRISKTTWNIEHSAANYDTNSPGIKNLGTYSYACYLDCYLVYSYTAGGIDQSFFPFGLKSLTCSVTTPSKTLLLSSRFSEAVKNASQEYILPFSINIIELAIYDLFDLTFNCSFQFDFDEKNFYPNYSVKIKNFGLGKITYYDKVSALVNYVGNMFSFIPGEVTNPKNLGTYYVAEESEPDYKIYLRSTGQYAAAILFKAGYQPDRTAGGISYFQIMLPNIAGESTSSPLTYNKSGKKGIRVNTDAGQTETVTFGDTIYVYVHPPGTGNNNYINVAIIQLQGLEDIQYVDV